jgi:hypothetical protein
MKWFKAEAGAATLTEKKEMTRGGEVSGRADKN